MIPCLIWLITSVIQGMSIVEMPMDSKSTIPRTAKRVMMLKKQNKLEDPFKEDQAIYEKHEWILKGVEIIAWD